MCGRFVSESPPDEIARYFAATEIAADMALEPSWNVAPTDDIYVVVGDPGDRRVDAFHWGLVPRWANDVSIGSRMINARAETIATSGAFKHAFARRRCLIPANGYYEWKVVSGHKKKQPYFIHRPDGEPYAFAGLWETWRRPDDASTEATRAGGGLLRSATIITTAPNAVTAEHHDRMPAILAPAEWDAWLAPGNTDVEALQGMLVPAPAVITAAHPVGPEVGDVRVNGPHLIDPVEALTPKGPPTHDGVQATLL